MKKILCWIFFGHLFHPLIECQSLLVRSLFIFSEIPLKAEDQMPSLGRKLSQAHLKSQVRAQSKQE